MKTKETYFSVKNILINFLDTHENGKTVSEYL